MKLAVHQPVVLDSSSAHGRLRRWGKIVGYVLAGVVVLLVLVGQAIFLSGALGSMATGTLHGAPKIPGPHAPLAARLNAILALSFDPSDRGVRRYRLSSVRRDPHSRQYRVTIIWSINNDVGAGTIGDGAAQDAYSVFRNVFSRNLPVSQVRLEGTYPSTGTSGSQREQMVMRLSMDSRVARTVNSAGWDTVDPQTLWPLIDRSYVAPAFQPMSTE